jgi:hypothetical protein
MKKTAIIILCLLVHNLIFAQNDSTKRISFDFSYFGENLFQPGYKLGAEYELWAKNKTRTKRNGNKIDKKYELLLTGNISNYVHFRNHIGLLLNSEIGYRYIRKKGFMYETSLGVGYLHTFLQGDTYKVTDDNEVKRVKFAGQSNFSWSFSFGIGKDYSFKQGKPWAWHIKYVRFMQYPFGSGYIYHSAIELGVIHYLKCNNKTNK